MNTIFLDLRPKEEFDASPIPAALNIPLDDLVLRELEMPRSIPKDTRIEYYYLFPGRIEELMIAILNEQGFMNLFNRGNITSKPFIYEPQSTPTVRPMEQKEKRTSHTIIY